LRYAPVFQESTALPLARWQCYFLRLVKKSTPDPDTRYYGASELPSSRLRRALAFSHCFLMVL
jgi:hypothetical protein